MLTTLPTTIYRELALQAGGTDKMPYDASIIFSYAELDVFVELIKEKQFSDQKISNLELMNILPPDL